MKNVGVERSNTLKFSFLGFWAQTEVFDIFKNFSTSKFSKSGAFLKNTVQWKHVWIRDLPVVYRALIFQSNLLNQPMLNFISRQKKQFTKLARMKNKKKITSKSFFLKTVIFSRSKRFEKKIQVNNRISKQKKEKHFVYIPIALRCFFYPKLIANIWWWFYSIFFLRTKKKIKNKIHISSFHTLTLCKIHIY